MYISLYLLLGNVCGGFSCSLLYVRFNALVVPFSALGIRSYNRKKSRKVYLYSLVPLEEHRHPGEEWTLLSTLREIITNEKEPWSMDSNF